MSKIYIVTLTPTQREDLSELLSDPSATKKEKRNAHILLLADQNTDGPGLIDRTISQQLSVSSPTIGRVRERFFVDGLPAALAVGANKRPSKFTPELKQHLATLLQSSPPPNSRRWSLRLLADALTQSGLVKNISYESVRFLIQEEELALGSD